MGEDWCQFGITLVSAWGQFGIGVGSDWDLFCIRGFLCCSCDFSLLGLGSVWCQLVVGVVSIWDKVGIVLYQFRVRLGSDRGEFGVSLVPVS